MSTKSELRHHLKSLRLAIDPIKYSQISGQAANRLIETVDWDIAETIHIYLPHLNEPDTWPIIKHAWSLNKQVYIPIVSGQSLSAALIDDKSEFDAGHYDVLRPKNFHVINDIQFDLIIVPTLGFDKLCNRLGYGKGYYDRFLSEQSGQKIGLSFDVGEVIPSLPAKTHDVPLDLIVTESRVIRQK